MEPNIRESLRGLKVVSFESRRAKEMQELIRRYGGEPIAAPSVREIPLEENDAALELLPRLETSQVDVLILMTGIGTKTLNQVLLTKYPQERIAAALLKTTIVARGPKPIAALKEMGLQPSISVPEPNTWREVCSCLSHIDVSNKRIAIQEYGVSNQDLIAALESLGASVTSIPVYRWALPEDLGPLQRAIEKLLRGEVDVALFTNGAQIDHLFKAATGEKSDDALRLALKSIVIGSVGPVCSQILEQFGLRPDIEPVHPKMGALVAEIAASARAVLAAKRAPGIQ